MFLNPKKVISQAGIAPYACVLDVGAGTGAYALHLAHNDPTLCVFAVDVQPRMVSSINSQIKNSKTKNLQAFASDAEKPYGIKLKNDTIDFALVSNVLFQIENKISFIKEISRVLKDNGKVLVVDWSDSHNHMGPHPAQVLSEDRAKQMFLENNFKIVHNIDAGDFHYGIIFQYES